MVKGHNDKKGILYRLCEIYSPNIPNPNHQWNDVSCIWIITDQFCNLFIIHRMTVMCKSHADHMYTTHFFDKTRVVTLDEESEDLIAGREAGGPLLFHGIKVRVRETGHISEMFLKPATVLQLFIL